jgi:hypothetical protein
MALDWPCSDTGYGTCHGTSQAPVNFFVSEVKGIILMKLAGYIRA